MLALNEPASLDVEELYVKDERRSGANLSPGAPVAVACAARGQDAAVNSRPINTGRDTSGIENTSSQGSRGVPTKRRGNFELPLLANAATGQATPQQFETTPCRIAGCTASQAHHGSSHFSAEPR